MKKNNLNKLLLCSLLLLNFSKVHAQENLSDGPQTLDAPANSTEEITQKTEAVPSTSNSPEVDKVQTDALSGTDSNDGVNANGSVEKATINHPKNPNGEILDEDELLKPKAKKETSKIQTSKVSESEIFVQDIERSKVNDNYKSLKLNDVIEQGLRKNYDQIIRNKQESLTDLTFDGAKNAFWLPRAKLKLTTDKQLISLLGSSDRITGTNNPKTPTGYAGLVFDDYTVFNWGKDYATYLNTKKSYERTKQVYNESKRELKLDLIYSFFNLASKKTLEKIYQDQLRQASFIYRMNKEKIAIGKASQQDYYQARMEYLRAQNEFHDAKMQTDIADENMSYLIADDVGTKYTLIENLVFKRIKISITDATEQALKNNPTILTKKSTLENAERSYDIAQKDNLPLPKFSVNLGAYKKSFGPATNTTVYTSENNNGNIELVASINATWDITGEDGLFNNSKLAKSRINKELANFELYQSKNSAETSIRETYKNILTYQNQMLIMDARMPAAQKTFDIVLDNYLNGKAKYNDFHLALIDLTETKVLLEKIKLAHLKEKLTIAKLIGIEDFPGENFEHLAVKVKGK